MWVRTRRFVIQDAAHGIRASDFSPSPSPSLSPYLAKMNNKAAALATTRTRRPGIFHFQSKRTPHGQRVQPWWLNQLPAPRGTTAAPTKGPAPPHGRRVLRARSSLAPPGQDVSTLTAFFPVASKERKDKQPQRLLKLFRVTKAEGVKGRSGTCSLSRERFTWSSEPASPSGTLGLPGPPHKCHKGPIQP